MDGAMKFVKGDTIAGIIVVLVSFTVAVSRSQASCKYDMSMSEAAPTLIAYRQSEMVYVGKFHRC